MGWPVYGLMEVVKMPRERSGQVERRYLNCLWGVSCES